MAVINLGEIPEMKKHIDLMAWARNKLIKNPELADFFEQDLRNMSDAEAINWCIRERMNGRLPL